MPDSPAMPEIAVPSCVIPGTIAQNACFLAQRAEGKIQEIALCLFESRSCLDYTQDEFPDSLAELPFSWHVHLPVDLPWGRGAEAAAHCALRVMGKAGALKPRLAVLHAPASPARETLLAAFAGIWRMRCDVPLLLENIASCDLADLMPLIVDAELGVCLDFGHMLAYGQHDILDIPELVSRVRLTHWSAPGGADRHLPLARLTKGEKLFIRKSVARIPHMTTHLLEIFDWNGIMESLELLPEFISLH